MDASQDSPDSESFSPEDAVPDVLQPTKPDDDASHDEEGISDPPVESSEDPENADDEEAEKAPEEPPIKVPTNPPFDPITGFVLAGYTFRSYNPPPDGAHQETFESIAINRAREEPEEEVISVSFQYPHAPMVADDATGVFMLTVRDDVTDEGDKPDDLDKMALTATLNSTTVEIGASFPTSSTILRLKGSPLNSKSPDDNLTLRLCGTNEGLKDGRQATHIAEVSLAELVKTASEQGKSYSVQTEALRFREIKENDRKKDYFETSKLSPKIQDISSELTKIAPEGSLPFNLPSSGGDCLSDEKIGTIPLTLDITYVPLASNDLKKALREFSTDEKEGDGEDKDKDDNGKDYVEDFRNAAKALHDFESIDKFENGNAISADERNQQDPKSKIGDMQESFFKDNREKADVLEKAAECLDDLMLGKDIPDGEDGSKDDAEEGSKDDAGESPEGSPEDNNSDQEKNEAQKLMQGVGENIEDVACKAGEETKDAVPSPVTSTFKNMSVSDPKEWFQENVESAFQFPEVRDWIRLSSVAKVVIETTGVLPFKRSKDLVGDAAGCLFLKCDATNTKVWFFVDDENKSVVVAFRGTEQSSIQDCVTDAQLFMQCWTPGDEIRLDVSTAMTVGLPSFIPEGIGLKEKLEEEGESMDKDSCAIHYGFLQAYKSIQDALHRAIKLLSEDLSDKYSFYFTGHSLGGALATLAAVDMQKRYNLDGNRVCMMSFGAPKVGNMNFAKVFNELVPNAFRIVNDKDAIAHLPESNGDFSALFRYAHAGRTVLMCENGEYWIEGVHDIDGNVIFDREKEDKDEESETVDGWSDLDLDKRSPWSGGSGDMEKMVKMDHDSPLEPHSMSSAKQHMVRC